LDPIEWVAIRRHTIVGEQILVSVPELRGAARLVRHSHERWDGFGYPDGLSGEEIPLGSRIISCADAFAVIRSDRAYRPGSSTAEALAEIHACAGTQFDPAVVEALEALAGRPLETIAYPHGRTDERVTAAARAAGFTTGFTTVPEAVRPETDPLLQGRLLPSFHSAGHFALQLARRLLT
jgi:HD-GYP domain-containing protein (c-di-GMP phosphodiesterase class II)